MATSSIALKDVLMVGTVLEEAGGRQHAFGLRTTSGRTYVFCCMSQPDLDNWLSSIKSNMVQSTTLKQRYNLSQAPAIHVG